MEYIPQITDSDISGKITFLPLYPKGTTHTNFPIKSDSMFSDLKEGDEVSYMQRVFTIMEIEEDSLSKIVIFKCLPGEITKP